jgi:hypothetical protein
VGNLYSRRVRPRRNRGQSYTGPWRPATEPIPIHQQYYEIVNGTSKEYRLEYKFGWWTNCSDLVTELANNYTEAESTFTMSGRVLFNISKENGEPPTILRDANCAPSLGAFGILGSNGSEYGYPCPVRQKPAPQPDSCKFEGNTLATKQVSDAMNRVAQCRGKSWPDVTGMLGPCHGANWPSSGSAIVSPAKTAMLFGALRFGMMLFGTGL